MRRRHWPGLLAVAACLLLAVPATAGALPLAIPTAMPPQMRALLQSRGPSQGGDQSFQPKFELETSTGYKVAVVGQGDDVIVEIARDHAHAVTAYVARGTVSRGRLQASFGDLGRVSVRFHPSGRVTYSKPRGNCHGADRFTRRLGVFAGDIRFPGEDNYLALHVHRAKGLVRTPVNLRCAPGHFVFRDPGGSGSETGHPKPRQVGVLSAGWHQAVDSAAFFALGTGDKTLFMVLTERSEGSFAIFRFASLTGPGKSFGFNDPLTQARVSPPKPFHGTGTYRAAPDGTKTWTGPLSVNFPGAPRTPLTGPQFEVGFEASF